ncbi:MAG: palindromic element RPE4 domain-containing protein [Rickettsia endosymbiont of Ecitomorpha arachnoides]|nr:palindromic element RPE4 domain-containing protein [Rickettsia endosymbiont of Ecitomorpha arachnoides]
MLIILLDTVVKPRYDV